MPAALAALGTGLAYAAISVYWGLGGTWLLDTVDGTLARSSGALAAVWAAAVVKAVAAALPVCAVADLLPSRRRLVRLLSWTEAVVLTGYGLVLSVAGWLVQAGVIRPGANADHRALAWHAYLWDPWFLVWGLLAAIALMRSRPVLSPGVRSGNAASRKRSLNGAVYGQLATNCQFDECDACCLPWDISPQSPGKAGGQLTMRANVYVDGFNLYYGALKGTPYKWLDLEALSRRVIPGYEIQRIRYFTARISPQPDDAGARARQFAYLRALAANPLISIHYGFFQRSKVRMALVTPRAGEPRTVEVFKTEEKGTDVNLAMYLLVDAFRRDSDLSLVISNDADLAGPIRMVMDEFAATVGIGNPCPRPCAKLAALGPSFLRHIKSAVLDASQLPATIKDKYGIIGRPQSW
jgi:Protein of unknown function (DUF3995)/NYN domain